MSVQNAYSPYGYHLSHQGGLGFNGERPDLVTGHYHLGNGYRAYNSVLMRFNGPDSLSPFALGGLNAYAYCQGDPVNFRDPSGHGLWDKFLNKGVTNAEVVLAAAEPFITKKFTRLVAYHGTKISNIASFKRGVSRGHSLPNRRLQGEGLYGTDDIHQAKAYAEKADGPGVVLGVFLEDGISLVPTTGYGKDIAGRIVFKPTVFPHLQVRELSPLDGKVVELREAPYELKKKPAPAA